MGKRKKQWMPLESNPDIMNKYLLELGAGGPYQFVDVFGVDPELLSLVPQPVAAVVLLYPISRASEEHRRKEKEELLSKGYGYDPKEVYFTRQTVGNACGTVGIIHTVLNLRDKFALEKDKFLGQFYEKTMLLTPEQRAEALEDDDEIEQAHEAAASSGDSKQAEDLSSVNLHFVALVNVNGTLYELDGRKEFPIPHGPTSEETMLNDAAGVVKIFMERDPTNLMFTICALSRV